MKTTMKLRKFIFCVCLCLVQCPIITTAQTSTNHSVFKKMPEVQRKKTRFVYGFYIAYMSGIIYTSGDMADLLRKKYTSTKIRRKTRDADADILLDAQDCIEENMQTLKVVPIDNEWYKVSFMWSSHYPEIPTKQHVICVKVKSIGKTYKIMDAIMGEETK